MACSERWKKAIAKNRAYALAHPEPIYVPSAEWLASQAALVKAYADGELQRAPGNALCTLMARLYRADGRVGERINIGYRATAIVLGEHRDIAYVPYHDDPGNLTIGGEIHVVLGGPVPVGGYPNSNCDEPRHWKQVYMNAPWHFEDGPWWAEIINVITPALQIAVEAAEAAQKKAATDAVTHEKAAEQSRVDTWVARRSSPPTTKKRSLSRSTKR